MIQPSYIKSGTYPILNMLLSQKKTQFLGKYSNMPEIAQEYATEMAEKQARIKDRGR